MIAKAEIFSQLNKTMSFIMKSITCIFQTLKPTDLWIHQGWDACDNSAANRQLRQNSFNVSHVLSFWIPLKIPKKWPRQKIQAAVLVV